MRLNASGVRDTARSVHICPNTVLRELRKKATVLASVNPTFLRTHNPDAMAVAVERAGEAEAEMDEMWSFVGNKGNPRWLWHAIDHHTGKVLAYVLGCRKDEVFLQLKALLEPFECPMKKVNTCPRLCDIAGSDQPYAWLLSGLSD